MQKAGRLAGWRGGLLFRYFRGRDFDAALKKIGFQGLFNDHVGGATPVNRQMPNELDNFRSKPEAGLRPGYLSFGAGHAEKIDCLFQVVNIINLTPCNNNNTILKIYGTENSNQGRTTAGQRKGLVQAAKA
ncbi:hypothetical protein [Geoalkalibacter sp.]|uniref:hypothetical protein n=1 Tax=Geoalkalibacter sp. TaxID=3041440 RepID=UPI00272E7B07|nr:hypothetical protein [Geoalkalibacter sp.]